MLNDPASLPVSPAPSRRRPAVALAAAVLSLAAACEGELSDDAYGYVDLAPYYYDGSSPGSPTAGLPRNFLPQRGWVNGVRAEYYDFGFVGASISGEAVSTVAVNQMAFFFDANGNPLFSRPAYERRTGLWHMRGGRNLLDPNPDAQQGRYVPYSIRSRQPFVDPNRNSNDYQRPIINTLPGTGGYGTYSGLWEVIEIIAPSGYKPDAIKSFETLLEGVDAGDFKVRSTLRAINCPVVDDRTYVTPSAMAYGIPRPRIELWYRTKMTSCYLVNGWEALGDDDGNLYPAGAANDARRINTFDVETYPQARKEIIRLGLLARASRIFVPMTEIASQDQFSARGPLRVRYPHEFLSDAVPRRKADDPPGYKPVREMWDILVPQDPPFVPGSFKDLANVETGRMRRMGYKQDAPLGAITDQVWVQNVALIGTGIPCDPRDRAADGRSVACRGDANAPRGSREERLSRLDLDCNQWPNDDLANADPSRSEIEALLQDRELFPGLADALRTFERAPAAVVAAATNIFRERRTLAEEGGPRCDVRPARVGEYCSPGIARCAQDVTGLPDANMTASFDVRIRQMCPQIGVVLDWRNYDNHSLQEKGAIGGYTCHPNPTGYCYIRCDSAAVNRVSGRNYQYDLPYTLSDGQSAVDPNVDLPRDSRCGELPGYRCLASNVHNLPTKMRVCLRTCSSRRSNSYNTSMCSLPVYLTANEHVSDKDIQRGMSCESYQGIRGCVWDPDYEPRDPAYQFVPGHGEPPHQPRAEHPEIEKKKSEAIMNLEMRGMPVPDALRNLQPNQCSVAAGS